MTDQRRDGAVSQQAKDLEITQKDLQILDLHLQEPEYEVGVDPYNSVLADTGTQGPAGPAR